MKQLAKKEALGPGRPAGSLASYWLQKMLMESRKDGCEKEERKKSCCGCQSDCRPSIDWGDCLVWFGQTLSLLLNCSTPCHPPPTLSCVSHAANYCCTLSVRPILRPRLLLPLPTSALRFFNRSSRLLRLRKSRRALNRLTRSRRPVTGVVVRLRQAKSKRATVETGSVRMAIFSNNSPTTLVILETVALVFLFQFRT